MGFDESKVEWTTEEMDMAEHADSIYESIASVADDGFQLTDLAQIPAVVPHIIALYGYLSSGSKSDYARKLIAMGVMLLRDNEWLEADDEEDEG